MFPDLQILCQNCTLTEVGHYFGYLHLVIIIIYIVNILLFMSVYLCSMLIPRMREEVKGQLSGISFLLLPVGSRD